ncbi:MAG: DUF2125 domain-containing protein [Pseudolabrys sp.]
MAAAKSRTRRYIVLLALVVLLVGGWLVFWQYASKNAEQAIAGWRAREAEAGRVYTCGSQSTGGFPFRVEVLCERARAVLQGAQPPLELKARNIHVAAQIYDPTLLISEFAGPFSIGEPDRPPSMVANWKLAQSSVRGTPAAPQRVSIVLDNLTLDRVSPAESMLKAQRIEIHGRIVEGSATDHPVLEVVLRLGKASVPAAGALAVAPVDADIEMTLRGLSDFSPKPWPQRFREIQAAGGRIDITKARVQQGDTVATGSGALSLNANGRLAGQINVAVAGLESFINAWTAANRQRSGFSLTLGLGLLGGNASVEGRKAIALPLRFSDGDVYLGPLKIGETAALF